MARPSNGPRCPTPEEINDFVDYLNDVIGKNAAGDDDSKLHEKLERLIEVLDWAGEQVNKRRLYSKKFQLKDKERTKLLKERLGEQYDDIVERARKQADGKLFEEVANEAPDKELLDILNENLKAK